MSIDAGRGKIREIPAVLDSGFRGYCQYLGKALPARVTVHSFRDEGNLEARDSQHGILCAEVLHALAPEAELLLANWEPDRPDRFLAAVRWAREQGLRDPVAAYRVAADRDPVRPGRQVTGR